VQVTELLARVLSGSPDRCRDLLLDLRLDAALGFTVLRLSSLPMLAPIAQQLEIRLLRRRWDRGDCPTCGNGPLLAELRGLEQFRWLRCGWCASQWQCDRLVCPFCGNRDHGQLREVVVEGHEDACRLNICDACGESLPTVATLTRLSPPALLVAEMETLHLRLLGP
jgi:FdhE protein